MVIRPLPHAGYLLNRVYAIEQRHVLVEAESPDVSDDERAVTIGWDWRVEGPRQFSVALTVEVGANRQQPETVSVIVVGEFRAPGEKLSISFANFVRHNAPAILLPYARQLVSSLTAQGPFGAYLLAPINVLSLVKDFDDAQTQGAQQLRTNPQLAAEFGLEYPPPDSRKELTSGVSEIEVTSEPPAR